MSFHDDIESQHGGRNSSQFDSSIPSTRPLRPSPPLGSSPHMVAHWDGIEFSPSTTTESNGAENTNIGYVLDEWDEEYDWGKRKKVRQAKIDFGGPNHFQKIALEKINLKKTKLDKANSGSLPFRI